MSLQGINDPRSNVRIRPRPQGHIYLDDLDQEYVSESKFFLSLAFFILFD